MKKMLEIGNLRECVVVPDRYENSTHNFFLLVSMTLELIVSEGAQDKPKCHGYEVIDMG